ncbi:hypothetical protein C8J56DRAFT_772157 [Mycena floridula]|nr:hypothetical protein C8J56DRAFT_772157 [Mycena floridula]
MPFSSLLQPVAWILKPVAYISLPVVVLRQISAASPTARYYMRLGIYLGCLTIIATYGALVAATLSILGRKFDVNYVVARSFYQVASRALGIQVIVEGQEHVDNTKPAIVMSNHQTMLDILPLGRLFPLHGSMSAKKSIQFTPMGPFMLMSGALFIDRSNNSRAVRSLRAAGEILKSHRLTLWMYPEGTRHSAEAPGMLPLKKGGFHLAIQNGIPIVPVVTENYWSLYHQGRFESGVIKIRVLPPVQTTGLTEQDAGGLAEKVREMMLEALIDISPKVASTPDNSKVEKSTKAPTPPPPAKPMVDLPITVQAQTLTRDAPDEKESLKELAEGSMTSSLKMSMSSSSFGGTDTEEDEGMVLVGRPS